MPVVEPSSSGAARGEGKQGQFEKVQFTKGTIIKQGDEGATFYVVEDGVCDAFIKAVESRGAAETRFGVR